MVLTWVQRPGDLALAAAELCRQHLGAARGHEGLVVLRAALARREGRPRGYQHHPSVVMWRGHERALCEVLATQAREWRARGLDDGCLPEYVAAWRSLPGPTAWPPWWGRHPLHEQQLAALACRHRGDLEEPTGFTWPGDPADLTPGRLAEHWRDHEARWAAACRAAAADSRAATT